MLFYAFVHAGGQVSSAQLEGQHEPDHGLWHPGFQQAEHKHTHSGLWHLIMLIFNYEKCQLPEDKTVLQQTVQVAVLLRLLPAPLKILFLLQYLLPPVTYYADFN